MTVVSMCPSHCQFGNLMGMRHVMTLWPFPTACFLQCFNKGSLNVLYCSWVSSPHITSPCTVFYHMYTWEVVRGVYIVGSSRCNKLWDTHTHISLSHAEIQGGFSSLQPWRQHASEPKTWWHPYLRLLSLQNVISLKNKWDAILDTRRS